MDLATELDIIVKSGSWYSYKDEKIGQGREKVIEYLAENPDVAKEIENTIRAHLNNKKQA